ncbi:MULTISPECIES: hypothetical protein [unclassified Nostoc]|uniref:hypothetical protein n=1 Tax=unclassified Nostoc TaxID=2593658 RepID=UPI00261E69D9|nr:hypothetical protein [Nostoc sp. S13]MDF5736619.1 hypothetical protein [Nostoc sp. S13]
MSSTEVKQEDITQGIVTFVQHYLPPLEAGDYTLKVRLVEEKHDIFPRQKYETEKRFTVRGERFQLNPAEVYALFPPENSLGEYSNCLPHIVFTRRTLPWERTIEVSNSPKAVKTDGKDKAPWLALLLLEDDDFQDGKVPKVEQRKVQDLVDSSNIVSYFKPGKLQDSLDYGEDLDDNCLTIDIPLDLFQAIAPTEEDLKYLAHTRDVSMDRKEHNHNPPVGAANSGEATPGVQNFSAIMGNRFPQLGVKSTVHLVSLEGLSEYLPQEGTQTPTTSTTIRLVSLKSWSFTARDEKESFQGFLEHLDTGTLKFTADPSPHSNSQNTTFVTPVSSLLEEGYLAVPHQTREGQQTISWYRGSFAPCPVKPILPFPSSIVELSFFHQNTGLYNISYLAAWELGRLLALQNKHFATALCNWKRSHKQTAVQQLEKSIVTHQLGLTLRSRKQKLQDINLTKEALKIIANHPYLSSNQKSTP